ncbi:hypothetical protein GCM10009424_16280 [Sphingomonas ursincola]|jgi:hypothetical protein|uniref:Uncharacterized protein n=1 Tax=Sphingomonas ursincola TaxID=56361 RepID=A0A7V8RDH4_9SPHN|nr:hypothetical protein [Sphingomonas ursincola]MBA1374401.1 hypothetical protein [Sphingomonas ursincola]
MPAIGDRKKSHYVPKDLDSIYNFLGWMMLYAPEFRSDTFSASEQGIDITFFGLNEGLKQVRSQIGEKTYLQLVEMSQRMRAHFEADPEDKNGECKKGRTLIEDISDIIESSLRRTAPRGTI